ncbi:SAM-dependent methyltransferase [Saccharomonospora sp. CUA-673]|uniref:class I SAM-dependent methyltransferase n=1 Tax=Saccharomonospora sp. CUA-673 TaxID=1904969 RepID=UPI0009608C70|nr:class I SAM-dependent methyltransferase [Saccharomonospora sp. CUA-673]OLT44223.1 SAM-dependent methyltransferase [Saccharomonospora sp. CUA-673]
MVETSRWMQKVAEDPGHSEWYVERMRGLARAGEDLAGEARLVDAMAPRGARILDAGCGPGRVAAALAAAGHDVVGVDVDPVLIAAAEEDHPGPRWLVGDLAEVDLAAEGVATPFDLIVCAGNVIPFLAPSTRATVVRRFREWLAPEGRAAVGFGTDRGYTADDFFADVTAAGLRTDHALATWDLEPLEPNSDFLVAILSHTPA